MSKAIKLMNLLSFLGIVLGILAILLSFTTIRIIFNLPVSFLPGIASLLLGILSQNIGNKQHLKTGLPLFTLLVSVIALSIGTMSMFYSSGNSRSTKFLDSTKIKQDSALKGIFDNLNKEEINEIFSDSIDTTKE